MTETINGVPLELLKRAVQIPSKASVEENHAAIVDRGRAQAELRDMLNAAPVSEAKAQGVVMPTVDQAMRVVLREMGSSKHIRGTSNWCADVGRAVLDEVARLNAAPAAPAADAGGVLEQAMYTLISIGYHENSGLVHELRQALAAHRAQGVV